jgi:acyl-coenzyme A thioesterase PaaI-like protein
MQNRTFGTVSPDLQKEMSGLEFVKGLVSGALPLNTIAQTLGYDVVEAESGRVAITLEPTGAHLNPWGTVHGGLTATLLDSCMGLASNRLSKRAPEVRRSNSRFRSSEQ